MVCSSSKTVRHHTAPWLCMYPLIGISQTHGVVVLAPSLGQHITTCDFFLWGYVKHCLPDSGGQLKRSEEQDSGYYFNSWYDTMQRTKLELDYKFDIAWWQMVLMLNVCYV
jgi:hypothetical protein